MEYKNVPPKDIQNILWGMLEYRDFDEVLWENEHGKHTVRDAVYNAWQSMHSLIKKHPKSFIDFIERNEPDMSVFEI